MLRLRRRHRTLLAVLLAAGVICGCAKDDTEMETPVPPAQLGGRLELGVEVALRLWGEPCDYVYEGKAGEIINLRVISKTAGLDPNVRLLDPSGAEEAFDDDSGGNGDALIREHQLRSNGSYKVRIETDEDRTGEVLLSANGIVEGTKPVLP